MKIINNTTEKLADDLRVTIKKRSRVSMAAACFSVYAFEELKAQLENKSTEKTYMFSVEKCFHQWCSVRSNVCKRGSCWQKG